MKLYSGKIGSEGQLDLDLAAGKLTIAASENTAGAQVTLSGALDLTYFVDQGAQKVNSPIVSALAAVVDGVLKTLV